MREISEYACRLEDKERDLRMHELLLKRHPPTLGDWFVQVSTVGNPIHRQNCPTLYYLLQTSLPHFSVHMEMQSKWYTTLQSMMNAKLSVHGF